jgi:hypothetical protein
VVFRIKFKKRLWSPLVAKVETNISAIQNKSRLHCYSSIILVTSSRLKSKNVQRDLIKKTIVKRQKSKYYDEATRL